MVTVEGFGFDPAAEYYCNFTASNGDWAVSFHVFPTSVTELSCVTPFWNFFDAVTSISLHASDGGAIHTFTPAAFHYIHRWFSTDSHSAPAKGGKLFSISGDGFHRKAEYRCEFSNSYLLVESPAQFVSSAEMVCVMPAWNHSAGHILLRIVDRTSGSNLLHVHKGVGQELLHVHSQGVGQDLLLLAGWDALSADTRDGTHIHTYTHSPTHSLTHSLTH